ncbi:hypothetical protein Q4555_12490 [Octadecabacter sp. 1_MG-2023]|uniref:hypothetical protein n=1 Tax=unclassified Octadecabacter TaxID=196158 RepID=UPI001C095815|nr:MULTISPECIES: hypothetical protein [unclassified Octadecabacter]MBU2993666.1 hypothetical protein [Octadecabacter sp. B2R22]MDO6735490.1 hypothetical protein [Octadecabacter sp. 1_MG-2023]
MKDLDAQLLKAHAQDDKAALVALYEQAADAAASLDGACFYLTHAYIFALELDHWNAKHLHARLAMHGRI